jgi:DNA excision repair protein ERCC-5
MIYVPFLSNSYVEEFHMADVERELGMDRETLVRLALLLGSDYTEGCQGVGIVNAVEVLHAFRGMDDLRRFRKWVESPDVAAALANARKAQARRKKKGRQDEAANDEQQQQQEQQEQEQGTGGDAYDGMTPEQLAFTAAHSGVRRNWQVPSNFPSETVVNAYLAPRVDPNKARFTFGRPDHDALRSFCW